MKPAGTLPSTPWALFPWSGFPLFCPGGGNCRAWWLTVSLEDWWPPTLQRMGLCTLWLDLKCGEDGICHCRCDAGDPWLSVRELISPLGLQACSWAALLPGLRHWGSWVYVAAGAYGEKQLCPSLPPPVQYFSRVGAGRCYTREISCWGDLTWHVEETSEALKKAPSIFSQDNSTAWESQWIFIFFPLLV